MFQDNYKGEILMIYIMNNTNIFITDNKDANYTQEKNPVTQEYFKDKEAAIEWGKEFIKSYLGTDPIDIDFNITEGVVNFTSETKLNSVVKVELAKDNKVIDVIELTFVEGIAEKELDLAAGEYELYFNSPLCDNDIMCYCLHEKNKYKFSI
jgi:hypothetical protein